MGGQGAYRPAIVKALGGGDLAQHTLILHTVFRTYEAYKDNPRGLTTATAHDTTTLAAITDTDTQHHTSQPRPLQVLHRYLNYILFLRRIQTGSARFSSSLQMQQLEPSCWHAHAPFYCGRCPLPSV